jgi:hypothetical protein
MACWFGKPNRARSPFTAQLWQKPGKPGFFFTPIKNPKKKKTGHPQSLPCSSGRGDRQTQCLLGQKSTIKKPCKNTCGELVELLERIGRLREKNSRVAQDYRIDVIADGEKNNAIRIEWKREPKAAQ